jgi:hypothetical protein
MEPKQKRLTEGQRRKLTRNKQENMLFCCMCFWGCVMLIGTLIELVCKFFNIDNYNHFGLAIISLAIGCCALSIGIILIGILAYEFR